MRVYRFLDPKFGLKSVREQRLKVSLIDQLNDPFEMIAHSSPDANERKALRRSKLQISQQFGLICFTRNWVGPLLWSHYAQKHQGICLGFDVPEEFLIKVEYVAKRIAFDAAKLKKDGKKVINELIGTKFSHWRYEKEHRMYVRLEDQEPDGLYYADFTSDLALKELIVGADAQISRADVSKALGSLESSVTVRKARLAIKTFSIVEQRKASLWG